MSDHPCHVTYGKDEMNLLQLNDILIGVMSDHPCHVTYSKYEMNLLQFKFNSDLFTTYTHYYYTNHQQQAVPRHLHLSSCLPPAEPG